MRTATALLTVPVALFAAACGSSAPTVCGDAIPQQEVFVGERKQVTPCFEDPGGGTLTLTQSSSNVEIVQAFLVGSNVGFTGISIGDATITVTATNEDKLSADLTFSVLVPNRAPEYTSTVTAATVLVNRSVQWNLMDFFTEPDGEEMTFSATSSNSGAAGVSLTDSIAVVSGLSGGESRITLTASDPHGEEGSGTVDVTVKTPVTVFEDGFDTDESLDDWTLLDEDAGKYWVEGGALHLEALTDSLYAVAERETRGVKDYTIEFTAKADLVGHAGLIWITGLEDNGEHLAYRFRYLEFTGGQNWEVAVFVGGTGWAGVGNGNSSAIEFDVFQDFAISLIEGNLVISVEGTQIINETIDGAAPAMDVLWLLGTDPASQYDYIVVNGFFDGDSADKRRKIAQPILDRMMVLPVLDMPVKR